MALTQATFNTLVEEHAAVLYRMAYRMIGDRHEAEDLVQETFRSAWKSRGSFQAELGERAWLASILRRRAVDRWRKQRLRVIPQDEAVEQIGVAGYDPAADEFGDQVQAALAQLPDQLREALLLVVVGELTHQEAADLLDVPIGTVLSRVSRARTRLRDLLLAEVKPQP